MAKRLFLALFFLLWLPAALAALPFPVGQVEFREVDETYAAEGLVEAVRQSTVSAQITGRIVELNFDVGDYVRQGQVIARIDESVVGAQAAGSEAQVAQARALLENAKANYERAQRLFEQKFISQAALDKALADYKAAQAQATAALAGAGAAGATRRFATLVAPYSGVVSARHVELGEMALPGKPIMTGFDPKDLRVEVSIPEYKVGSVRAFSRAIVEIPAIRKWVKAKEVIILPVADARTHTTRVRLLLPPDSREIYPGMFARAHFTVGRAKKLLLPTQAVLRRSELAAVYVVGEQDRLSLRQVRLGEPVGEGAVEVLAGVMPGERVALDPIGAGIYLKSQAAKRKE
ncbi:MAG: efflux RND transporter periplasmic adaptor subunit [Burkholderiales bacterium]|nr:efflux RND transporter periplasmic adaptor subunit [Burkholderiales bacterium]